MVLPPGGLRKAVVAVVTLTSSGLCSMPWQYSRIVLHLVSHRLTLIYLAKEAMSDVSGGCAAQLLPYAVRQEDPEARRPLATMPPGDYRTRISGKQTDPSPLFTFKRSLRKCNQHAPTTTCQIYK
ncbi:hypothetical protein EW146_g8466 [Bondarzewia mesenterica]|uniref:Uncharacterized protein n=1 Tax=Bondarzewia mesenterica TaxID=1095465 RepID=A0A4S4LEG5_9AGAM|nr:hypothetical protein EW146_g8466 [Bondarzewia mesenterica]